MKNRMLISIAAVALFAVLMSSAFAQVCVPVPPKCDEAPCGFTPGFWKHNIQVRLSEEDYDLDLTNGAYSAFSRPNLATSPYYNLDGVKLDKDLMDALLVTVNWGMDYYFGAGPISFEEALTYLQLPGNNPLRTNTANWFNWAAGYGWY